MTRNYTYKEKRDLIATLNDKRGTTAVVNRSYEYNALGIPTKRTIQRQGTTRNDVFTHNDRNELTAATMGDKPFAYDYDNIGNRKTAQEEADDFTYTANALNQYTEITENEAPFTPAFDADGNQTRIKTATGIWEAVYNALWYITWDPTEPVATRPLAIQKDGTWYTYGFDLPKNITEVYGTNGTIKTAYTYTPYGQVTLSGSTTQPIQWSSEYADTDLGLVYYNYRHYNPLDGRWCGRDPNGTENGANLYIYTGSNPLGRLDVKGLSFEDLACYLYMTNPESEYKTCIEQCEIDLYYDFKSIERFVNSANQANSSIGAPHGASPQEIMALALYVIAYVKYKSCLSDCTYAYKHNSKCKTLECPIIL